MAYCYIVNRKIGRVAARSRLRGTRHFSLIISSIENNEDLAKSRNSIAPSIFFEDDEFSEI